MLQPNKWILKPTGHVKCSCKTWSHELWRPLTATSSLLCATIFNLLLLRRFRLIIPPIPPLPATSPVTQTYQKHIVPIEHLICLFLVSPSLCTPFWQLFSSLSSCHLLPLVSSIGLPVTPSLPALFVWSLELKCSYLKFPQSRVSRGTRQKAEKGIGSSAFCSIGRPGLRVIAQFYVHGHLIISVFPSASVDLSAGF